MIDELDNVKKIIHLLQCPLCRASDSLAMHSTQHSEFISEGWSQYSLLCSCCGEVFPITKDGIPILWSKELKAIYLNNVDDSLGAEMGSHAVIQANKSVYDHIYENYDLYSPGQEKTTDIMVFLNKKLFNKSADAGIHVDFACGPGLVIKSLLGKFHHHIGVDISINNLRRARDNTGCSVICADACHMPFQDESVDLLTESGGLHHIEFWKSAMAESFRILKNDGGFIFNSEPSVAQMRWSRLAIFVFDLRFPIYKFLSYFLRDKYNFRNTEIAKLNVMAEVHHQPLRGLSIEDIILTAKENSINASIISSPKIVQNGEAESLLAIADPNWKQLVISLLSFRNPFNPDYGSFTAFGLKKKI